ncbi:MAG: hypothetical protein ABIK09_12565 [Pseudomonadota bacterium]
MITRLPALVFALAPALAAPAAGQVRTVLASKGGRTGQLLVLENALDMARGFDRRTLITVDYPDNKERRRFPLLEGGRAARLVKAGDWELFRALEDRALGKALEKAAGNGFSPVTRRRDLRTEGTASFSFSWGGARMEILLVPGQRKTELFFRKGDDGPERRLARILPESVAGPDGPTDLGANSLREVALLGDGRVLVAVVGAWDTEGGRCVGWERLVLLPMKRTADLWGLPHPLEPVDDEWRTP